MKAIITGATGLVGSSLLQQCLKDDRFTEIRIFVRRKTGISSSKLKEFVIDFDRMEIHRPEFVGDVLFSALGTTRKSAGSIGAQRIVDYEYQLKAAVLARSNDVRTFVLISAANADAKSFFAYPKMKGELEVAVGKLGFPSLIVLRPGLLMGQRTEKRLLEEISLPPLKFLSRFSAFKAIKPVEGSAVAAHALKSVFRSGGGHLLIGPQDLL